MATVTLTITAAGNTAGRVKTVSGADLLRWAAAKRKLWNAPNLTDDEIVSRWADEIIQTAKRETRSVDESEAISLTLQGVTDIAFT